MAHRTRRRAVKRKKREDIALKFVKEKLIRLFEMLILLTDDQGE